MGVSLAVSAATARHLQEYGTIVAGTGALVLLLAGVLGLGAIRREGNRETERYADLAAGLLLGIGFLLALLGLHRV